MRELLTEEQKELIKDYLNNLSDEGVLEEDECLAVEENAAQSRD